MKIGIIGSGNMRRSSGLLWAEQEHEVFLWLLCLPPPVIVGLTEY